MLLDVRGMSRRLLRLQRHMQNLLTRFRAKHQQNQLCQTQSPGDRLAEPVGLGAARLQQFRHPLHDVHHVRFHTVQPDARHHGIGQGTVLRAALRHPLLLLDVVHYPGGTDGGDVCCHANWTRSVSEHLLQCHIYEN